MKLESILKTKVYKTVIPRNVRLSEARRWYASFNLTNLPGSKCIIVLQTNFLTKKTK